MAKVPTHTTPAMLLHGEKYRTVGAGRLTPDCPLDVFAAAAAARLTGQPFAMSQSPYYGVESLPPLSAGQAQEAISLLRRADLPELFDAHPWDFLRGIGQQPTLAERVARLLDMPLAAEHIQRYREPVALMFVSLRWETHHISDVPAARRWQGSEPVPRHSHLGRNILAAMTLADLWPAQMKEGVLPALGRGRPTYVRSGRYIWPAPVLPISYAAWHALAVQGVGSDHQDTPIMHRALPLQWWAAPAVTPGKTLNFGAPECISGPPVVGLGGAQQGGV